MRILPSILKFHIGRYLGIDREVNWILVDISLGDFLRKYSELPNLVPRACDPWEGTRGSGIIRCRKPGFLAKIELCIPFQRPIRFLPETDYPRASRSFPRIAGSGNEIVNFLVPSHPRSQDEFLAR
jgi:hypothetical protein